MNENVKRSNRKYHKPMPGKSTRKPQRNPFAKIPPFMIPELIKTKSGRIAVAETGGARGSEGIARLSGNAFIYCSKCGGTRKPIFTFEKKVFENHQNKQSMLFKARINDYVIAESHRNHLDDDAVGCINVIAYQLKRNYSKTSKDVFRLVPVFQFYKKFNDNSELSEYLKKSVISSADPTLMSAISEDLEKKGLTKLKSAVEAVIFRANATETTYAYYHGSKLADQFSKA